MSERTDRFDKGRNANKPRTYGDRSRMTSHVFSHATTVVTTPKNERCVPENTCEKCGKSHDLDDYKEYLKKSFQERREFLNENELCFACYGGGHRSNGCAQRRTCKRRDRRHPTGLHDDNFRPYQPTVKNQNSSNEQSVDVVTASLAETEEAVCSVVGAGNPVTALPIVPVTLKAAGTEVLTYAVLDSCSTGIFVLEDVAACLDVEGADTRLMMKTVNGTKLQDTKVLKGLTVADLNGANAITLPKTYAKEDISAIEVDVRTPELTRRWKHLNRIAECMHSKLHAAKVALLIGSRWSLCVKDFCRMGNSWAAVHDQHRVADSRLQ